MTKLVECYIFSIPLYGARICILKKVGQKCPESFDRWCWRRKKKVCNTDGMRKR